MKLVRITISAVLPSDRLRCSNNFLETGTCPENMEYASDFVKYMLLALKHVQLWNFNLISNISATDHEAYR